MQPSKEWLFTWKQNQDNSVMEIKEVVRCKNCKHRPTDYRNIYKDYTGFSIEFPDDRCPCQCEDGWYNWYPEDNWYCANGEMKTNADD